VNGLAWPARRACCLLKADGRTQPCTYGTPGPPSSVRPNLARQRLGMDTRSDRETSETMLRNIGLSSTYTRALLCSVDITC
jgi:hypothetical protein